MQSADDLQRMLKCMAANGFLNKEMAVKIMPMEPHEYLQTAELHQRSVGFMPAGTQVCACDVAYSCWHPAICLSCSCADVSLIAS